MSRTIQAALDRLAGRYHYVSVFETDGDTKPQALARYMKENGLTTPPPENQIAWVRFVYDDEPLPPGFVPYDYDSDTGEALYFKAS